MHLSGNDLDDRENGRGSQANRTSGSQTALIVLFERNPAEKSERWFANKLQLRSIVLLANSEISRQLKTKGHQRAQQVP